MVLTMMMPKIEQIKPTEAKANGADIRAFLVPRSVPTKVAAIAIEAIIEPQ